MRGIGRSGVVGGAAALTALVLWGCGGTQPQPQASPSTAAEAEPDSAERARRDSIRREREAVDLCSRAEAALEAGNYQEARRLFRRAVNEYGGTGCARRADDRIQKVKAIEVIKQRIHFEFDRSRITDQAAQVLQRKAEVLRRHPELRVTIEGHCDERGSLEYNQALGMRRAQSTREYLVSLGLDADRFETVSYGEERPLVDEHNESAWAQNRRAEFVMENPTELVGSR